MGVKKFNSINTINTIKYSAKRLNCRLPFAIIPFKGKQKGTDTGQGEQSQERTQRKITPGRALPFACVHFSTDKGQRTTNRKDTEK